MPNNTALYPLTGKHARHFHDFLEENIASILAKQRQDLKKQVMETVESYLEDHAKDTKPWRTYTGTTFKQVIEEIEKRIEAIFEKGGEK